MYSGHLSQNLFPCTPASYAEDYATVPPWMLLPKLIFFHPYHNKNLEQRFQS